MLIDRQDVLYAIRSARRTPLLTFVAVLALVRRHRIECRCFRHPQFRIPQLSNEERPRQLCPDLSPLSRLVYRTGHGLFLQRRGLRRDSIPSALARRCSGVADDRHHARRRTSARW